MGILDDIQKNSLLEKIRATYPAAAAPSVETSQAPASKPESDPGPANFGLAPGFRIVAVAGPLWPIDPDVAYAPDASQAERAAALEMFEWDRMARAREPKVDGILDSGGTMNDRTMNDEPTRAGDLDGQGGMIAEA